METTEKIVEAYCRYVKGWFTIPNVRCAGQYEADLLAVDVSSSKNVRRYHIECGVSISGSHSKLTADKFSPEILKTRLGQSRQRRTLGYFTKRKFDLKEVHDKLEEYGFKEGNYTKVIVTWGWEMDALEKAKEAKVELWDFREILDAITTACRDSGSYFADDTLRTVQLLQRSGGGK